MTLQEMADLHARCFVLPPPWSADAIKATMNNPHSFLLDSTHGFLIGRVVAEEAELLTLAVDPAFRRQRIGAGLVADFVAAARFRGAGRALLEVAANNAPARALYTAARFVEVGVRRQYYRAQGQEAVDALVFSRHFD